MKNAPGRESELVVAGDGVGGGKNLALGLGGVSPTDLGC